MQLACPECGHVLEFSGQQPSFCAYCGKPLSSIHEEATRDFDPEATRPAVTAPSGEVSAAPWRVGSYRLVKPLGAGGMGTVYEAEDTGSGRHVALKLIAPQYATSSDAVVRFRQEGRLASLIAHPRCVFVLGADEYEGRPYIVMELMSGQTLQDVAERRGPLPIDEAVAKILDVIEGLQEAHRLGVIHRDVKPSNCFVLADGCVKVGDFGLAKSLIGGSNLTKTGTFLGTLLYAPPEQIKGEDIDFRTDVYSVAATLYHLLTGRPPYQGKDPASTLARTVSEAPPPPSQFRPELPRLLERVILRGLERSPDKRWRDLEEMRQALLPFAPGRVIPAGLGARLGAALIDFLLILPLWIFVLVFLAGTTVDTVSPAIYVIVIRLLELLPLALLEGRLGWSPGKWLLRLRVCTPSGLDPPGLRRGLARTGVFYVCLWLPTDLLGMLFAGLEVHLGILPGLLQLLGFLILIAPMRAHNGYRGLHEWLSGTRVVRLPWPERRQIYRGRGSDRLSNLPAAPAEMPTRLGPYLVRKTLWREAGETLLVGEDAALGRSVWLRLVPEGGAELPAWRRGLTRPTRLPWLIGGKQDGWIWDGFLAPQGCPLTDLVDARTPLPWSRFRPLLLQLTDELVAAHADGSLPRPVSAARVWVTPGGRVQVLDGPAPGASISDDLGDADDSARALALLRQVTILALEGQLRPRKAGEPIHAPVPASVALILDRLMGVSEPYRTVEELQADLIALQAEPTEVDAATRSAHLALLVVILSPVLLLMLGSRYLVMQYTLRILSERAATLQIAVNGLTESRKSQEATAAIEQSAVARGQTLAQLQATIEAQWKEYQERLQAQKQAVQWDWLTRFLLPESTWRPEGDTPRAQRFDPIQLESAVRLTREAPGAGEEQFLHVVYGLIAAPALWCVLWALLARGGFAFRFMGIALCRANGRPALRLQCAWRALLFWAPVVALLCLSAWVQIRLPGRPGLSFGLWASAVGVLVGYMLLAIWFPTRSLHDRLAGTYLVPK